jgi:hypothetical protein
MRWKILLRPRNNTVSSGGELGNIALKWCDSFKSLVYICRYLPVSDGKWKQTLFHSTYICMKPLMWLSATSCWIFCCRRTALSTRNDFISVNHLQQPQNKKSYQYAENLHWLDAKSVWGKIGTCRSGECRSFSNFCKSVHPAKICFWLQNAAHVMSTATQVLSLTQARAKITVSSFCIWLAQSKIFFCSHTKIRWLSGDHFFFRLMELKVKTDTSSQEMGTNSVWNFVIQSCFYACIILRPFFSFEWPEWFNSLFWDQNHRCWKETEGICWKRQLEEDNCAHFIRTRELCFWCMDRRKRPSQITLEIRF